MQPIQQAGHHTASVAATQSGGHEPSHPGAMLIHSDSRYTAYATDLEYMWHWEIIRDGEFVQEGCSLSETSSREAVTHVIRHFNMQDQAKAEPGSNTDAIRKLLLEVGVPQPLSRAEDAAQVETR
ncbi:MAG: soluble methane monooxygenase-binding protein MmoD [Methylocystis sp.]|jgi:methane monooxygenase component D